ncbi:MAG: L-seryl-tRNA(Sec) selenium transferase [bacterium]|nr:L-seryl-tRNA(Sec) selenium transferase [bacterium]
MSSTMRGLPAVHRLLAEPAVAAYGALLGGGALTRAAREVLDGERARIRDEGGEPSPFAELIGRLLTRLAEEESAGLVAAVNAAGVLVHTNLGRAPLADEAVVEISRIAAGYSNLEFDLRAGVRGSRYERVNALLCEVSGAEDALVVNNNAAAVLLVLDTFAKGREVVVARSQLVEIGGGFRIPDVLRKSGCTLVEVGATNKTYVADYQRALTTESALLLRCHTSNYRIDGFTHEVSARELAELGHRAGVPVVEDLGSGTLVDLARYGLQGEPTVQETVAAGVDLVTFSGDKLLGGPQAGVIVGRKPLVARLRANPLLRALRVDKLTLAALAATLRIYVQPEALERIPIYRMLARGVEELEAMLNGIRLRLEGRVDAELRIVSTSAYVGGGSLPTATLPSRALAVRPRHGDAETLARRLREHRPAVVGRIEGSEVLLDARALRDEDLQTLHDALASTLAGA